MESFVFSLKSVLPLFVLIVVGYGLRRMQWINEDFVQIGSKVVFRVSLPILLFLQIAEADLSASLNPKLLIFTVVSLVVLFALLMLLVPRFVKKDPDRGAMIQALLRGNYSILGIPLAVNMFGAEGAVPAALLLPFVIPIYNVFSIVALSYFGPKDTASGGKPRLAGQMLKEIITNPLIIGIFAALPLSIFRIQLPALLTDCLAPVSQLTTPLALICLGGQFSFADTRESLGLAIGGTLIRQLLIPVIMLGLALALGFRSYDLGALMITYASPAAVTSYIMAKHMHANDKLAASLLVFSTAFSCLSLTLTIYLLRSLGYF